eukprot:TRINITY_DN30205_c0_g1_i1.p3 TRINITY_DN30205_c0_g1~~TRINITY_DN30205_c0_g1_i1.p3  ORF type:complete len:113 (-),score=22.93 TRINITY_DN30205_c0_g1_i1:243-581(-)
MFFFFKQKTAYERQRGLVGSEMCIRDSFSLEELKQAIVRLSEVDLKMKRSANDPEIVLDNLILWLCTKGEENAQKNKNRGHHFRPELRTRVPEKTLRCRNGCCSIEHSPPIP